MKNTNLFQYLAFIFFSTLTLQLNAQERHTITLTCNTSEITEQNLNEVCSFGQTSSLPNKDYSVEVQVSDVILWNAGYADPNQGYIDIKSIDFESGTNIFKDKHILDEDDIPNGTIVAIVKKGETGDELKYAVTFDAYNQDGRFVGRFEIDPKIKIKPPSVSSELRRN